MLVYFAKRCALPTGAFEAEVEATSAGEERDESRLTLGSIALTIEAKHESEQRRCDHIREG